jgi:hypothetical protein
MDGREGYDPSGYRDRNRRRRMSQASVVASIDPDMRRYYGPAPTKHSADIKPRRKAPAMTHLTPVTQAGYPIATGDDTAQISFIVPPVTS